MTHISEIIPGVVAWIVEQHTHTHKEHRVLRLTGTRIMTKSAASACTWRTRRTQRGGSRRVTASFACLRYQLHSRTAGATQGDRAIRRSSGRGRVGSCASGLPTTMAGMASDETN